MTAIGVELVGTSRSVRPLAAMDVAITGASGLIGTELTRSLTAAGHRPIALVRRSPSAGADEITWNPSDGTIDAPSLEGVDALVHLAGAGIGDKRWNAARKAVIRDSRVDGTALVATTLAGLDRPPSVFVSGSATGFYGSQGDTVLDESSPKGEGFLSDVVEAWERAAQPAIDAGIRTVFPRTGIVLSTEGGALKKQLPLFKLGLGGRFGSGDQYQSWISIDDEIAAIEWLIDSELSGPVNLTAPNPVTNREFTETLGSVVRRPTLLPVPLFGPKLLFGGELVEELLLTSQRIEPTVLTESGFSFEHPTLEPALRALIGA